MVTFSSSSSPYSITLPIAQPSELSRKLDEAIISVNAVARKLLEWEITSNVFDKRDVRNKLPTLLSAAVKTLGTLDAVASSDVDALHFDTTTLVVALRGYKQGEERFTPVGKGQIQDILEKLQSFKKSLSPAQRTISEIDRLRSELAAAQARIKNLEEELAKRNLKASIATTTRR